MRGIGWRPLVVVAARAWRCRSGSDASASHTSGATCGGGAGSRRCRRSNRSSRVRRRCRRRTTLIPTRWTHASGASMACTRGQFCKARVKASDVASRANSMSPVATTSAASRRGWAAGYHDSNEPQPDGVASTLGSTSGAMSPVPSHDSPGPFSRTTRPALGSRDHLRDRVLHPTAARLADGRHRTP
jgi:hypothetical protein